MIDFRHGLRSAKIGERRDAVARSATPHGTMPEKCDRSGSTLSAKPCSVTQCRTRMPMAAILSSAPSPLSGRRTHTPTRSSRRSPRTSKAASVRMIQSSIVATKRRTSGARRLRSSIDIADALARAVIGELAAAAGGVDRKARVDQLLRPRRRAGGVKGRVLQQPDQFVRFAARDRGGTRSHGGKRVVVVDQAVADPPFDRRRAGGRKKPDCQIVARVNHPVTMPW